MKNPLKRKSVKLWLKALRSGLYKQTIYTLRDNNGFCCLGVACEVYNQYQKKNKKKQLRLTKIKDRFMYNSSVCGLPFKVKGWLGLTTCSGTYIVNKNKTSLIDQNDAGVNFNKIANIIESNPKGLFVE